MDFTHCNTKKSRHSYFHNEKRKGIVLTPVTFQLALAMLLDFKIFIPSTVHSVPATLSTSQGQTVGTNCSYHEGFTQIQTKRYTCIL